MTKRVRAFVPDLMDRSRLRAPEASVEFVADPAVLLDEPADLFVLDLARSDSLLAVSGRSVGSGRVVPCFWGRALLLYLFTFIKHYLFSLFFKLSIGKKFSRSVSTITLLGTLLKIAFMVSIKYLSFVI